MGDGPGSEDEIKRKDKTYRDGSFESEPRESDESYGKKKKRKPTFGRKKPAARKKAAPKRKPAKKKPAKKKKRFVASDDDDSEDSDFETKDRKRRHMAKEKVERETRGVQLKKFEVDSEEEFKNRVYSDDD